MGKILYIVTTQCQPEVEEEFNKWYNEIHIPKLFEHKSMKKATRYKILNETPDYPAYLAIYEFENRQAYEEYAVSPELAAARQETKEFQKQTDGGFEVKWRIQYEEIKTWEKQAAR